MNLKLRDEFINSDLTISFTGKGGIWGYNLKQIKPNQYQTLYKNGFQHLFEEVVEDMPLYEEDEPKVLIDNTSNKKKAVTAKTKNDKL